MSDEAWRAQERRWRQEPSDQDALGRAIAGMRRSGLVVPPDLLDARIEPATALDTTLPLEVWAVLPGEREPTTVGWGPGTIAIPPHRYWGVGDVPAGLEGLGALGDELRGRGIPGLRLRELAPSPFPTGESHRLGHEELRALGRQPQLRWVEVACSWLYRVTPVTPGQLVRALGCSRVEVLRVEALEGADGEEPGARLEGLEELIALREVTFSDRGMAVEHLRPLHGLRELDGLFLHGAGLGVKHFATAPFAARLRRLRVGRFHERDAVVLTNLPSLADLSFECHSLSARAASGLGAAPRLSELSVEIRGRGTETDLDAVLEGLRTARLTRLSIGGSPRIGDRGLAAALSIEGLRALRLKSPHEHVDRSFVPSFRELTSLEVGCQDVCWRGLLQATSLRALDLTGPGPDIRDVLAALPDLAHLRLGTMGPVDARVTNLPRLESLTLLDSLHPARFVAPLRSLSIQAARSAQLFDVAQGTVDDLERLLLASDLSEAHLAQLERLQSLRELELEPLAPGENVVEQILRLAHALPGLRRLAVGRREGWARTFIRDFPGLRERLAEEAPWIALVSSID